ncbi:hypothetical protein [uncultured Schumannella sp.]|uniref:hypothetical protein n=1 Tax=uncultured Schumannella sp. TaxID=1195956 RepID=UPI0025CBB267|nr:hypothetical protein [uncultured Schumannella sp.]
MADVDPRFDPRFQRGYDPERHAVPAEQAPARAAATPVAKPEPAEPSEPEPSEPDEPSRPEPSSAEAPATASPPVPPPAGAHVVADDGAAPSEATTATRARTALLALAVVMTLAAVLLMVSELTAEAVYFSSPSEWETFVILARGYAISPLLLGGIIALLGWIIVPSRRTRDH